MKKTKVTKYKELNSFAGLLMEAGFKIISSYDEDKPSFNSYFHFFKDGYFGYCQKDNFEGYSLSTVNKPCSDFGTGTMFINGWDILTVENAEGCLKFCKRLINTPNERKNYSLEEFLGQRIVKKILVKK